MNKEYNPKLINNAKNLRKSMTSEEKHLWYDFLKKLPVTVKRQKVIDGYIVDFCCSSYKVIIELDGSQHYEEEGQIKDKVRDKHLNSLGYKVLRYSNRDVNTRFDSACADILKYIKCYVNKASP